jgi:hypothetical protein
VCEHRTKGRAAIATRPSDEHETQLAAQVTAVEELGAVPAPTNP